jgi:uncharacterized protein (TIGR02271 family)
MGKTAVGLYESSSEARQVLNELVQAGFSRNMVRIMLGDNKSRQINEWFEDQDGNGHGAYNTAGGSADNATARLTAVGVPAGDARMYEEALHRGHALVSVSTGDDRINKAVEIMSRFNILDINDRASSWNLTGATAGARTSGALRSDEETTLPVIEEEVHVSKRAVESGGVRVRAIVTETPVQETVSLREEHVAVERRPVDRPVSAAELNTLRDQTIEVRETSEQAVVEKQARVVEEVVVRKDVDVRQEQVTDSVRRTDVEVEQLGGAASNGWNRWSSDFNTHYKNTYARSGRDFSDYEPAYRYGYGLASRPDWRGRSWDQIEPDVRRDWESRNQGPWEDFKDAVRHAWQRVTT